MRISKKILIVFLAVLAASLIFVSLSQKTASSPQAGAKLEKSAKYFCPMHPDYTSDKPGDCPICQMRLVPANQEAVPSKKLEGSAKKILFYRHPMRPDVSSPVPAKDEMGMDYIPVYAEEAPAPSEVCAVHDCPMIKAGEECPMLVLAQKGETVECPACKAKIEATGNAVPAALPTGYASVLISPEKRQLIGIRTAVAEKKLMKKEIRAVGRIAYDPELYEAQAEYIQSVKSLKASEAQGEASPWAVQLVESAKTKLTKMGLNAQLIDELSAQEGPDKSLLYAVPDGPAWVYANIYEYEIPLVKVGDELQVEAASIGRTVPGQVRSIDTVVDPETRTVRVRATIKNEGGIFKPDMYVNVKMETDLGEIIAIPNEAVFFTGTANIVFVDKGEGLLEPRHVVLGQRGGDFYEVKEGLEEGERIVVNGNFLVDSESRLRAALTGGGHQHGN